MKKPRKQETIVAVRQHDGEVVLFTFPTAAAAAAFADDVRRRGFDAIVSVN